MKLLFFFKNQENLGIEYLSSILKKNGHQTDLLFDPTADEFGLRIISKFSQFSFNLIDQKIQDFQPDYALFSVYTNLFPWVENIAKYLKKKYNLSIIMGGPHPTIAPDYIIKKDFVDYLFIGESEFALIKFFEIIEKNGNLNEVPNLCYKKDNQIFFNSLLPLNTNLDELPFPDKDLFWKFGAFTDRYYIMGSRGCPNNCSYCINHQLHSLYHNQPFVRRRSAINVVNEIKYAIKRYKIKSLFFYDDDFILNKNWLFDLKNTLKSNDLFIPFKCLVHPQSVTIEKIKLLKEMGCTDIDMGIESGSEIIRKNILKRNVTNNMIIKSASIIKSSGIHLSTLNIINIPDENFKDMLKTLFLNKKINPSGFLITSLTPYPNTEIFHYCIEKKYVCEEIKTKIYNGGLIIHDQSIINHPFKELGGRIRMYGAIVNKLPRCFNRLILYLPALKLFNILQLIFSTSLSNAIFKIKEFLKMILISRRYYYKMLS